MFNRAFKRMSATDLFDALNAVEGCQQWGLTLTQHGNIIKLLRLNQDDKMFIFTIFIKEDGNLSCWVECHGGLDIGLVHPELRSYIIPAERADAQTVMAYLADIRGNLREFFGA